MDLILWGLGRLIPMDDIAAWLENYKLSYPKPKRWEKKWPWTSTVFAVLWNHTANESMVLRFCCQFQEESSILTVESEGLDGNRHSGTTAWNIVLWPTQIERYSGLLVVPKLRHMLVSFTSETLPGLRVCFRKNSIEEKIDESPLQGPTSTIGELSYNLAM